MNLDKATNRHLLLKNAQPAQTGDYSVTVRNGSATMQSADARLEVGQVAAWGGYYSDPSLPFGLTNILAATGSGGFH